MWLIFTLMSFSVYRITRFIILDSLIEMWRERFYEWVLSPLSHDDKKMVLDYHEDGPLRTLPAWRRKLYQLSSCPFCISAYVAGAVLVTTLWVSDFSFPMPVWWWLGIWTGGLIVYRIIDADD